MRIVIELSQSFDWIFIKKKFIEIIYDHHHHQPHFCLKLNKLAG